MEIKSAQAVCKELCAESYTRTRNKGTGWYGKF
jgi:hypothetical protein